MAHVRIVCAPDSYKESMTAAEAAAAMARGVHDVLPDAECVELPLADGGEGFADALTGSLGGRIVETEVVDARGRPIVGRLLVAGDLGVIEVAQAVGLGLLPAALRDPTVATSRGVGLLIAAALDAGCARLVVGLGGSATNDGGAGMLAALGARFLDETGEALEPLPRDLPRVASVDATGLDPRLAGVRVEAACDVTAPLCGPAGASAVFGPQKGATPDEVARLDAALAHLADVTGRQDAANLPGAGAAGGLGWALLAFLGARTRPGLDLVADLVGLDEAISSADLVLTGEGSVDAQTLQGKTPAGVAARAARAGVPVVVLAGRVAPGADVLLDHGVTALVPILPGVCSLPEALAEGPRNLRRAAATVVRLWAAAGRS